MDAAVDEGRRQEARITKMYNFPRLTSMSHNQQVPSDHPNTPFDSNPDHTDTLSDSSSSSDESDELEYGSLDAETYLAWEQDRYPEVVKIVNDTMLSDSDKIDALAHARGWFQGSTTLISAYLSATTTLPEIVDKIAAPIDEAYTTADHGQALWEAERVARGQREYCATPEEALELWGPEEEFPAPEVELEGDGKSTTEGQLWELWYGVLHAAKRIPWDDEAQQNKLVDLVKAFKARPDPPPPAKMTKALKTGLIWSSGSLWSHLIMLSLSARETWNDSCGVGAGFTPPEQRAWMNVNAFVARLTISGTRSFQDFGGWAMRDALEDESEGRDLHYRPPRAERRSCVIKVAAVWILVAGKYLYERRVIEEGGWRGEEINLDGEDKERFPWDGCADIDWTDTRWTFWRRMFEKLAGEKKYTEESRALAARTAKEIATLQEVQG